MFRNSFSCYSSFSVNVIFASVVHVSRFRAWTLFIPFLCQLYVISLRVRFAVSIHFALLYHALSFISCHRLFYFFTQLAHVNRFWALICIATFICQLCVSSLRVKFVVSIHFSVSVSYSEYYFHHYLIILHFPINTRQSLPSLDLISTF